MEPSPNIRDEHTGRYLPVIYPDELPFWDAAKRRELRLQCCVRCFKTRFPIGPICPQCHSTEAEWARLSGLGTVHNYVVYHKAWTPWYESRVPYAVIQVQLREGPRLTANILDCLLADVHIGMAVEAAYEDITDAITLVQFRPAR